VQNCSVWLLLLLLVISTTMITTWRFAPPPSPSPSSPAAAAAAASCLNAYVWCYSQNRIRMSSLVRWCNMFQMLLNLRRSKHRTVVILALVPLLLSHHLLCITALQRVPGLSTCIRSPVSAHKKFICSLWADIKLAWTSPPVRRIVKINFIHHQQW